MPALSVPDAPIGSFDREWDAGSARSNMRDWATEDGEVDIDRYQRAFLVRVGDASNLTSYKIPVADIIDGELTIIPAAVFAAAGGRGISALDAPAATKRGAAQALVRLYERMEREPPPAIRERASEAMAVATVRVLSETPAEFVGRIGPMGPIQRATEARAIEGYLQRGRSAGARKVGRWSLGDLRRISEWLRAHEAQGPEPEEPAEEPEEGPEDDTAEDAEERTLERAVESMMAPWSGRVVEAEGESAWEVVVLEAGLSTNGNWWPASLLSDKGIRALEGAPIEVIEIGRKNDHLPMEILERLPSGVVVNLAGQLTDVRFDRGAGGRVPKGKDMEAIASVTGLTQEEVERESQGSIFGLARFNDEGRGAELASALRSAEARGGLESFLGVSVDFERADPILAVGSRPLRVRTDIDLTGRNVLDVVTRPSGGGKFQSAA